MDGAENLHSERVLILAPVGRDEAVAKGILKEAGMSGLGCRNLGILLQEIDAGAAAAVITEESVKTADLNPLVGWLKRQPPWSDFPFVILTQHGGGPERNPDAARLRTLLGNVSFLERPFHPTTFLSVVESALRGRRRQYEASIRLDELKAAEEALERTNESLAARVAERTVELAASDRRFRAIFDSAIQMTALLDLDGRIIVANRTALDAVGVQLSEVAGRNLWLSPWWSGAPREANRLASAFPRAAGGEFVRFQADLEFPGGPTRVFDVSLKPIRDEADHVHQIVAEAHDISELRRIEASLRQSQKLETIGQLTGGVAHDFNNLLMAVIGNLELLKRRLPNEPRIHRLLDGAMQGAQRGAALTQRLLAFARRQDLQPQSVDVTTLLNGMEELLHRSLGPQIELTITRRADIPPVLIDPNQLELAILNLSVNARDAMAQGGSLSISLDQVSADLPLGLNEETYVRLSVVDTGCGMDEQTLKQAIEPFFSTKGVGKGTGLGLSMIHGMAVQSGGALTLRSAPGEGTVATLYLPLADEAASVNVGESAPIRSFVTPSTILVVDDDALIAMSTVDMLEDLGHKVIDANSGPAALRILQDGQQIDLLVTDHAMPGMTGVELAQAARALRPDLPILLATGYAELPSGVETDLPRLAKPYQQQQLADHVSRLLRPKSQ